jgi:hypothetical protein
VGFRRKLYRDWVVCPNLAADKHDGHHPAFSDQIALRVAAQNGFHQPGLKLVQLAAWIPQACDFDDRGASDRKVGSGWQAEQVQSAGRDVFTHVPGGHGKSKAPQFVVQLPMDKMDLAVIWLRRIARNSGPVLNGLSQVRVALHPKPFEKHNSIFPLLAECVLGAAAYRHHYPAHPCSIRFLRQVMLKQ